jgi:hypothetical protein
VLISTAKTSWRRSRDRVPLRHMCVHLSSKQNGAAAARKNAERLTRTAAVARLWIVAPKKKKLDAQLRELTAKHDELVVAIRRLATHAAVLAVAVRQPEAVPAADLDAAVAGISELATTLVNAGTEPTLSGPAAADTSP